MSLFEYPLQDDEIHIWHHRAGGAGLDPACEHDLLSADERRRAASMTHSQARVYVSSRARLRRLIADYTGLRADRVCFSYDEKGRPELAGPAARGRLHFSTSHSGDDIVHALSRRRLGVDIERLADAIPWPTARRAFSPRELEGLLAATEGQRARHFFTIWTKKEAYVKAHGGRRLFRDFEVSPPTASHSRVGFDTVDPFACLGWAIYRLDHHPGCAAALAVEGTRHRIRHLSAEASRLAA